MRKDGAYLKTQRINEIHRTVVRNAPVDKGELIAHIEATVGLTKRRVEEYIDLLVASKRVSYNETEDTYSGVAPSE